MTKGNMTIAGYVCLALTAVLLFVAWERYSTNAKAVETANRMMNNSPMGEMMGGMMGGMMQQMTGQSKLEPSVPAATTYSILFAVISGVVGAVLLGASQQKQKKTKRRQPEILFGTNKPMNPSGGSDVS